MKVLKSGRMGQVAFQFTALNTDVSFRVRIDNDAYSKIIHVDVNTTADYGFTVGLSSEYPAPGDPMTMDVLLKNSGLNVPDQDIYLYLILPSGEVLLGQDKTGPNGRAIINFIAWEGAWISESASWKAFCRALVFP